AAGQTDALANVAFTNAGVISGAIRNSSGIATGSTTLYLFNASSSVTTLPSSNTYLFPVVAPGPFTLQAQTNHPQGSPLEGLSSGAIAAGQRLIVDVILPPTGVVSGQTIVSG